MARPAWRHPFPIPRHSPFATRISLLITESLPRFAANHIPETCEIIRRNLGCGAWEWVVEFNLKPGEGAHLPSAAVLCPAWAPEGRSLPWVGAAGE